MIMNLTQFSAAFFAMVMCMWDLAHTMPVNSTVQECQNPSEGYLRVRLEQLRVSSGGNISTQPIAMMPNVHRSSSEPPCTTAHPEDEILSNHGRNYVCPWVVYEDEDLTRFPSSIIAVRCSNNCEGRRVRIPGQGHKICQCELVERRVTVLRRAGCEEGVYVYLPDEVMVGVSCACSYWNGNNTPRLSG